MEADIVEVEEERTYVVSSCFRATKSARVQAGDGEQSARSTPASTTWSMLSYCDGSRWARWRRLAGSCGGTARTTTWSSTADAAAAAVVVVVVTADLVDLLKADADVDDDCRL